MLLAVVAAGAYLLLGGDGGVAELWHRWRRLEEARTEVARLQAENDSLRLVLWRLENDLDYVEKVAREDYGMSRDGERVYRLPPADSAASRE